MPSTERSAFIVGAAICFAAAQVAIAQPPAAEPRFEVASVRLDMAPDQTTANKSPVGSVRFSGARVAIDGFVLKVLIATAYRTEAYLTTAPDWTSKARVVIQALMPEGATKDQLPEVLKALLAERFHLTAHKSALEEPVYAMEVAKNGAKLNPPRDLDQAACAGWSDKSGFDDFQGCSKAAQPNGGTTVRAQVSTGGPNGPTRFEIASDGDTHEIREEYLRMTMQQLARRMSTPCDVGCLNLPVVDRTGLAGAWDFSLNRTCLGAQCDTYASTLEKIGLKLEKTTAPVERLVVDQIDKVPTEN